MTPKQHLPIQPFSVRPRILIFSEHITLATSIVGAIATAITQQSVYAVVPFALSLTLNLANRQHLDHQMRQRITVTIDSIETSLLHLDRRITYLRNQLATDLSQQLAQLAAQPTTMQVDQRSLMAAITECKEKLAQLNHRFNNELQSIILQLHLQSEVVRPEVVQAIEQSLQRLSQRFSVFEAETRQMEFHSSAREAELSIAIHQSVQQLFERVTTLEDLLRQLTISISTVVIR